MALYEQWLSYQKQSLINKGVNIQNISNEDISIYYFEYYFRTLQKMSYMVYLSDELVQNPLYKQFKTIIDNISSKANNADDLMPYLSKGIKNIQRPDKMLNDWGVLHLHLGRNIEANGFVARTKELLFIFRDSIKRPNELYFLDIFNHGEWSQKRTIEIIKNNWSDILEMHKIERLIDIEPKLNDDDHLSVRENNINSPVIFNDGSAYLAIGGGLTTLGTNMQSTDSKIYFMKYFQNLEKYIINEYKVDPNTLELKLDDFHHVYINQHFLNEKEKIIRLEYILIPKI